METKTIGIASDHAGFALKQFVKAYLEEKGLPYKDFPKCDGVVAASFCMDSGDLATPACHDVRTGYYTPDNMPGYCNHGYLTITDDGND